jgi:acyl-CoA dehydrogenase
VRFSPTDEQTDLARTVRQLLTDATTWQTTAETESTVARKLWGELAAMGSLALAVPESLSGQGAGMVELGIVAEEMGAALPPVPFTASGLIGTGLLVAAGGEAAGQLLPQLASGTLVATYALPLSTRSTTGLRSDPATGLISGETEHVPFGGTADVLLTMAATQAGSSVLVAIDLDQPGVRRHAGREFDLSEPVASITVTDAPARVVTGAESATAVVRDAFARLWPVLALELLGTGRQALADAVRYSIGREQFGRPIGSFQAIKHLLAKHHVALETARSLALSACWLADRSDDDSPDLRLAGHTAYAAAAQAAHAVAADNIQVQGGIGFTWESGAHRQLRRTRARRSAFGTAEHHLDLAADLLLPV